jgi:hypothetical protein
MVSELSRLTSSPGELESFLERLASDEARLVVARGSVGRTEKRGALGARRGVRPLVVGVRARRGQKGGAVSTH